MLLGVIDNIWDFFLKLTQNGLTKDLLFYIINDKYLTSNLKGAKINDSILFVYGFDSDTYIAILAVKDSSEKGEIKLWLDQD